MFHKFFILFKDGSEKSELYLLSYYINLKFPDNEKDYQVFAPDDRITDRIGPFSYHYWFIMGFLFRQPECQKKYGTCRTGGKNHDY